MFNVYDLISAEDYFIFLGYSIVFFYLLRAAAFSGMAPAYRRLFAVFYFFKVLSALVMTILLVYYWGISDNIDFYIECKNFVRLLTDDISNSKYFFLPVEDYNEKIRFDNEMVSSANSLGIESNFLVIKFQTLLYPLALGKYMLLNFFFSLIAAVGQFKMFLALSERYPHLKRNVAVAVLLMPSVLLYSSYINKETLCMGFMGFAVYNLFAILNNRHRLINSVCLLINCYLFATAKLYVLTAFLLSMAILYLVKLFGRLWAGSVLVKITIGFFFATLLWLLFRNLEFFDSYVVDFAQRSNAFQEQYHSLEQSSAFEFGEVETSFAGVLKKMPLGIYTTYFRPSLWEGTKPIIFFSALESTIVLLITVSAFFGRRKNFRPLLKEDVFAGISFYYVLIFGVIVGLTTFNFGSLVRYKIPAVPFLLMLVFLLLHFRKKDPDAARADALPTKLRETPTKDS